MDYFLLQRRLHGRSPRRPRPLRPAILQKEHAPLSPTLQILPILDSVQRQGLLDLVLVRRLPFDDSLLVRAVGVPERRFLSARIRRRIVVRRQSRLFLHRRHRFRKGALRDHLLDGDDPPGLLGLDRRLVRLPRRLLASLAGDSGRVGNVWRVRLGLHFRHLLELPPDRPDGGAAVGRYHSSL